MLMLSRLYNYNADKFFAMLNALILEQDETPEITFDLQVVGDESVPDAIISQKSFKIVVETKLHNQFQPCPGRVLWSNKPQDLPLLQRCGQAVLCRRFLR